MTTVFALLAGFSAWHAGMWWPWLAVIALLFLVSVWFRPGLLAPLNKAWFRFGLALHAIINPMVMGILFFGAVTPTGWIMRLRVARNEAFSTGARSLIWTATLTWLSLALFYGSAVAFSGAPRSDSIVVGWTNRILVTTFVLWLLVAAFHVRNRNR